jgi:hypothetical protein
MLWRFWQPKYTVEAVADRLASGLLDGSVELDDPFEDLSEADGEPENLLLELEIAEGLSDASIMDLVTKQAMTADEEDRRKGGKGLRIGRIDIRAPKVNIAMRPREHRV